MNQNRYKGKSFTDATAFLKFLEEHQKDTPGINPDFQHLHDHDMFLALSGLIDYIVYHWDNLNRYLDAINIEAEIHAEAKQQGHDLGPNPLLADDFFESRKRAKETWEYVKREWREAEDRRFSL